MSFPSTITAAALAALDGVQRSVYWLDRPDRPEPRPPLRGSTSADLVVIGAGFSGLWAAYLATERYPGIDVVLLDGGRVAHGASGRNGGFVAATLTHGIANGMDRWPGDMPALSRLGLANLTAIQDTIEAESIECDFRRVVELSAAVEPYQVAGIPAAIEEAAQAGVTLRELDAGETRARVHSPTYLGSLMDPEGVALADPARFAWGLAAACERRGVRVHELSPVRGLQRQGTEVEVRSDRGVVAADRVALATSAYPPLLRRLGWFVLPVYDSVLVTEPLTPEQRDAIGWLDREAMTDLGNQFHYYRVTEDGRILWGGYDASYYGDFGPHREHNPEALALLSQHFLWTFPQLEGIRFSHSWSGAIDTCSRFSAFWGTAFDGRVAYSLGFTGLGVGASRFGAQVMLDRLWGERTERTELEMVRSKPLPFPPQPLRSIGVGITRWSISRADENEGRRNAWLRTLDMLGLGFDS